MEIHGSCKPRFEAVSDAFEANFAEGLEIGAAAAVAVDGEFVANVWAGDADTNGTPWQRDTIVNVYSTTKTMAATCMLMLADRGELNFDAPVAQYWPEFAQNGKDGVLVRHVMAHTAGVPASPRPSLWPTSTTSTASPPASRPRRPGGSRAPHRATTPSPRATSKARSSTASPAEAWPTGSAPRWPNRSTPTSG